MADQPAQRGYDPAEESGWGSPMPAEYGSLTTFLPPLNDSPARPEDQGDPAGPGGDRNGDRPGTSRRPDRRWWTRKSAGPDDAAEHSPNGLSPAPGPAPSLDPVWAAPAAAGDERGDRGPLATPAAGSPAVAARSDGPGAAGAAGADGTAGRADPGRSAAAGAAGVAAGVAAAQAVGAERGPVQPYGPGAADTRAVPVQPDGAGRNRVDRAPGPPPITRDPLRGPATTIMPIPVPLPAPGQQQTPPPPDEPVPEQTRASFGSRRQQRKAARPQWAQSKRTVRHLNVWTVFKVSLAFYVIVAVAVVVAAVMLWYVADALGSIQTIEKSVKTLFDLSKFTIHPSQVAKYTAIGGGGLALCGTFANVLAAFTYNLISDLVGGIRFDVVDEGR